MYFAEPEATTGGRGLECARGRVIGGSSSINAMAYVRGNPGDYDRWASSGLDGWSYAHVLPYFRRQESWKGGASFYRGGDGPLATQMTTFSDPLADAFAASGLAAGYKATPDYNGAAAGRFWRLADDGEERPALQRGGRLSAAGPGTERTSPSRPTRLATRIVFDGRRAAGVEYERRGAAVTAHAAREVILCGGVINSPQLLMLSGIGDPAELAAHGIAVKVALQGVGKNLQDHISASVAYRRKKPGAVSSQHAPRPYRAGAGAGLFQWRRLGERTADRQYGFLKSRPDVALPDVQLIFNAAPMTAAAYLWPFRRAYADAYACRAAVLRPESRGRVELVSADPKKPVRIRQNFLATDNDRKTLRAGLRIARDICRQAPMQAFAEREIAPGIGATTDADLDAHIRANSITVHHPLGTCKMGVASDPMAVVDAELRVFGTEGLRVVDGSAMPDLVGANINAPIIMIAERPPT